MPVLVLLLTVLLLSGCATPRQATVTQRSGVDRGETLIGIPALQAPVVSIPIPEIALFKWTRHRGLAELQLYAYDPHTDQLVEGVPAALGRAKYDEFKVLLVIGFAVSDLDERAEPAAERR